MNALTKIIATLFAAFTISNSAIASIQLITFDDINTPTTTNSNTNVPTGYAGLTWNNMGVINTASLPGTAYSYGVASGANAGFTTSGGPGSFSSTNVFTLNSIYLTIEVQGKLTEITASLNGVQEYSTWLNLSDTQSTLETFNWTNINQVTINANAGWNVIMDNIVITPSVTVVPVPAAIWLFGSTLVGLIGLNRRKTV